MSGLQQRKGSSTPTTGKGKKNAALQSIIQSANTGLPTEKASIPAIIQNPENQLVIRKLVMATVMMLVFPICAFYFGQETALESFGVSKGMAQNIGVISGVATANLIILGYVISAFRGE